jgi:hypothetical protein
MFLTRTVETVEAVDVWDILIDPVELESLTCDPVKQGELIRLSKDKERLQAQLDDLIRMFPDKRFFYKAQFRMQLRDIEKEIRALLPGHDWIF